MNIVILIEYVMTAALMTIHILDERYKRKRIAEIEDKLKGRYRK